MSISEATQLVNANSTCRFDLYKTLETRNFGNFVQLVVLRMSMSVVIGLSNARASTEAGIGNAQGSARKSL